MRKFVSQKTNREYNSFLEVISNEHFSADEISIQSLLEFLTFGSYYFEDTLVNRVKKKFTPQLYTLEPDKGFIPEKPLTENPLYSDPDSDPVGRFVKFFENRVDYLNEKRISIDLTGGIDSRLVATILHYLEVDFDALFSLKSGSVQEAKIVQEVADCLGIKVHIIQPDEHALKEEKLGKLFQLSDGLWDFTALESLKHNQLWREKQGYDLVITGVGGELYKDFWWQQDFPFYKKNQADVEKLIKMRMYPVQMKEGWIGKKLKPAFKDYQKTFKEKLKTYVKGANTQTYDQIYYHVRIKEQVSLLSNITAQYLDTYSPLLDPQLLKIGYNLPRSKRFFNQFHRDVITKINPEVAKIRTTEGNISVSDNVSDKILDLKNYGFHKAKSLLQKLTKESPQKEGHSISRSQKVQERYQKAQDILTTTDLISEDFPSDYSHVPKALVGRLITVAEVVKRLK